MEKFDHFSNFETLLLRSLGFLHGDRDDLLSSDIYWAVLIMRSCIRTQLAFKNLSLQSKSSLACFVVNPLTKF